MSLTIPFQRGLRKLQRWTAPALLLGGVLLIGSVLLKAVGLIAPSAVPEMAIAFFAVLGHLAAFVGLLGLYPRLVAGGQSLARTGAAVVGLAGAWLVGLLGWTVLGPALGALLGPAVPASPPDIAFVGLTLALGGGFGLCGLAGLRATALPGRAGSLLAAFAGTWLALFALSFAPSVAAWQWFVVYALQPPTLLALGWSLRHGTGSPHHASDLPGATTAD